MHHARWPQSQESLESLEREGEREREREREREKESSPPGTLKRLQLEA